MTDTDYSLEVADAQRSAEWDDFLQRADGHHEQTSCWADAHRPAGWKPLRILLRRSGDIVGGGQLSVREVRGVGVIVYIRWGPVFATTDPRCRRHWVAALDAQVRLIRATYVVVNPLQMDEVLMECLKSAGYRPKGEMLPPWGLTTATLLIDLSKTDEELLAGMQRKNRRGIRIAQKSGLVFREGSRNDLPGFFDLMKRTAERRGVKPKPARLDTFERIWAAFRPKGWVRLFMVERDGETLCSGLAFPFGSTVRFWKYGWSGDYAGARPNHLLHWHMIIWARTNGYRWFDIMQVDPGVAEAARNGLELTNEHKASPICGATLFKLGFGGIVATMPGAHYRIANRILALPFQSPWIETHFAKIAVRRFASRME